MKSLLASSRPVDRHWASPPSIHRIILTSLLNQGFGGDVSMSLLTTTIRAESSAQRRLNQRFDRYGVEFDRLIRGNSKN